MLPHSYPTNVAMRVWQDWRNRDPRRRSAAQFHLPLSAQRSAPLAVRNGPSIVMAGMGGKQTLARVAEIGKAVVFG